MATKKTSSKKTTKKGPKPIAKAKPGAKPAAKTKVAAKPKAVPAPKAAKAKPAPKAAKAKPAPAPTKAKRKQAAPKATAKMPLNAVIHWEIQAKEPGILQEFYGGVFGWAIDADNPMKYGMVTSKGAEGINGGIGGSMESTPGVVVYTQVPSIAPVLKLVEERGGKTLLPRTDIGPVVMALYLDPEGNRMGLLETR